MLYGPICGSRVAALGLSTPVLIFGLPQVDVICPPTVDGSPRRVGVRVGGDIASAVRNVKDWHRRWHSELHEIRVFGMGSNPIDGGRDDPIVSVGSRFRRVPAGEPSARHAPFLPQFAVDDRNVGRHRQHHAGYGREPEPSVRLGVDDILEVQAVVPGNIFPIRS